MLVPDEQFAESILDALDERSYSEISLGIYGVEERREKCWAEQRCRMINVLLDWLERRMRTPQTGEPLWQAATILCDHLISSKSLLLQKSEALDEAARQARVEGKRLESPCHGARSRPPPIDWR